MNAVDRFRHEVDAIRQQTGTAPASMEVTMDQAIEMRDALFDSGMEFDKDEFVEAVEQGMILIDQTRLVATWN